MKKLTFYTLWILAVLFCASCKQKLTCDNPEGISLIKSNVKSDIVEAWALKLAAEDYKEYKYGWFDMSEDYKTYLLEKLAEIKRYEGEYYEQAVQQYIDNEIELENIIPEKYDESIDKCECTANIILTNSDSKNKISYDIVRNSEGEITGHYIYRPKAMLDDNTNASDFIKEHKDIFE
jgi:hypothetical protein